MNNCPKCGNPLQIGVTSCPICGTDVAVKNSSNNASAPVKQTVQVAQVSEVPKATPSVPVQPVGQVVQQPSAPVNVQAPSVQQSNPVQNNKVVSSVANTPQSVANVQSGQQNVVSNGQIQSSLPSQSPVQTPLQAQENVQMSNQGTQPVQNSSSINPTPGVVNQMPISQSTAMPVGEQPVVQQSVPQGQVVQNVTTTPIVPTAITPTVEAVPTPGIPVSLTGAVGQTPSVQSAEVTKGKEKKEKNKDKSSKKNKQVVAVAAIALVAVVAGALYVMFGSSFKLKADLPKDDEEPVAMSSVVSHGFKFGLQDGWLVSEDQNNVIVTNSAETVSIRFSQSQTSLTDITEDIINAQLSRNQNFSDSKVGTTQIGARDSYVVNTTLNETLPIQIYFISGGPALTLGVTVIYQSAETKTKLESNILEMIGSISYSDDSIKAISTTSMYSEAFNMFNNVVTNKQPEVPEVPVEDDQNNQENENNGENQTPETETSETQSPVTPETPVENSNGQVTE